MNCKTCRRIRERWREILARRDIRRAEERARAKRFAAQARLPDEPPFRNARRPDEPPVRNVPPEDRDR